MVQISRGHHTVPRFYLQGFADDRGFVNVVRLPGKVRYPQSVAKVSVINDFYNVGKGPQRDAIEKLLADEIEGPAAAVFRKVLIDGSWPLKIEDRSILSTYFALQHGRGANQRKSLTEMADVVSKLLGGRDGLPEGADARADALKRIHIETMLDFETTAPYFFGRMWSLITVPRGLLTCDTPLSLIPFQDAPVNSALGIGTAEAIVLPMAPTTAVVMAMYSPTSQGDAENVAAGRYDVALEASDEDVAQLNRNTIRNARQSLYHHPADSGRVPDNLPHPRAAEISTSHATWD